MDRSEPLVLCLRRFSIQDFVQFLDDNQVMLGFLRQNRPIPSGLRTELLRRQLLLLDNLALPDNLDVTRSGLAYLGYLMLFAPFSKVASNPPMVSTGVVSDG